MALKYTTFLFIILALLSFNCNAQRTKFTVPENKVLFIIGQDMGATGGFSAPNNQGYVDHFESIPAGFTTYTSINRLEGLRVKTNYGSGDICAGCYLQNSIYDNSVMVVGLYMVDQLSNINNGELDNEIETLGNFIANANRPVFVRIGYEFNASWAAYNPTAYIQAFRYIVDLWDDMNVLNFNTVWQSDGYGTKSQLLQWYPGNDYVDWMAYSHFDGKGESMLQLAREKQKQVMIAEATPRIDLKTTSGLDAWNNWYQPFLDHIQQNTDVIKAFSYINNNWEIQDMWKGQDWGDSRIQANADLEEMWLSEINKENYLMASSELFMQLNSSSNHTNVDQYLNPVKFTRTSSGIKFENKNCEQEYTIEIYSIEGKQLFSRNYTATISAHIPLEKNKLYLLRIIQSNQINTYKIMF